MNNESGSSPSPVTTPPLPRHTGQWEEPRVVVLLIGIVLLLEGIFIYLQAGVDQLIVASVTGVAGLTLVLFAWLVPLEEEPPASEAPPPTVSEPTAVPPGGAATGPTPAASAEAAARVSTAGDASSGVAVAPPPVAQAPAAPPPAVPSAGSAPAAADTVSAQATPPAPAPSPIPPAPAEEEEAPRSWFDRLRAGLKKTRDSFVTKVKHLVFGKTKIDDDLLDELEGTLFEADIGVKTTQELLTYLHKEVEARDAKDPELVYRLLKEQLRQRLTRFPPDLKMNPGGLTVFLIIGVNGVGKTTTIAKLARRFIKEGKKVVLAAGDTFRAAAIDQLSIWGQRVGAEVIKGQEGGDPGALVFDAIHAARKRQADLLLIDTAGRMHVKVNLMDELKKVRKIVEKESDGGPHEILLVLDATTGQNAVQQAKLFHEALPITGIVMTKLDGTAKGGVLFAVEEQIAAPVKFIGVGEKMDDLMTFDPEKFLDALFEDDSGKTKESDYQVLH
ncbi:MAG: Signal recognition particle receptor protein FtsY [Candidatus Ozemobacter sibiricus]|jgi:fused signal recognition particle receptor|uniref:Signal recognition particle receptor FtsY n=1 Tax=Candidatus Ozemobacter sibiricus TaxID=2268124 RepID=A0A367ZS35_9BACT|nr:MAG: Signal recognition particle receptor protein FtsY [Candidatus Ozemobacter sibiricus]